LCCIHVSHSSVVFFVQELGFRETFGSDLTLVEHGIFADRIGHAVRDRLSDGVNDEDGEGDEQTDGPLFPRQGNDLEDEAGPLDDDELETKDDTPHSDEHEVVEEAFEDVVFVVDLPGADHVHNLHEHKQVEEEGEVLGVATGEYEPFLFGAVEEVTDGVELVVVEEVGFASGEAIAIFDERNGDGVLPFEEKVGAIPVLRTTGVDPGTVKNVVESVEWVGLINEELSSKSDSDEDD